MFHGIKLELQLLVKLASHMQHCKIYYQVLLYLAILHNIYFIILSFISHLILVTVTVYTKCFCQWVSTVTIISKQYIMQFFYLIASQLVGCDIK